MNWKEIKWASQFAKNAHKGQLRVFGRDAGKDYFKTHVKRVATAVSNQAKAAAYLHDVVEDCDVSMTTLAKCVDSSSFPLSEETYEAVVLLTHEEDKEYSRYISNIILAPGKAGKIAREVKIADIMDNWSTSPEGTLRPRYEKALHMLLEVRITMDTVLKSKPPKIKQ